MEHTNKRTLAEAFEARKFAEGTIKFSNHKITDKHIQDTIDRVSVATGIPASEIVKKIEDEVAEFAPLAAKAPILYNTISKNIVEDETFKLLKEHPIDVATAPKFSEVTFFYLIRCIKTDHDQFLPLRSFLDPVRLHQPMIEITPIKPQNNSPQELARVRQINEIDTAAASPKGEFYFNKHFMQQLIDFAHIKGIQPKGKKYTNNGGKIPPEYAWIEFLIMHEFMHYTYDDFHYQNIIKDANPTIINWVGDFRTNYLLVKSGYEQLPMGLFNDAINYDRQKTYKEMYDLVKSEMEKLDDNEKNKVKEKMDKMSDDHEPGQEAGKKSGKGKGEGSGDGAGDGSGEGKEKGKSKIDEHAEKVENRIKNGKDASAEDVKNAGDGTNSSYDPSKKRPGGQGAGANGDHKINYDNIKPKFNWKQIVNAFITSQKEATEETYQKPSRRSISGIHTARQIGSGAVKPGEMVSDLKDIKLAFVIDCSGSMSAAITKIMAEATSLIKGNAALASTMFTLIKFSDSHKIYRCVFKSDMIAEVHSVSDKGQQLKPGLKKELQTFYGSSTNFNTALTSEIELLQKNGYNILMFSDEDVSGGDNLTNITKVLNNKNGKSFLILDTREAYLAMRKGLKTVGTNVTYLT